MSNQQQRLTISYFTTDSLSPIVSRILFRTYSNMFWSFLVLINHRRMLCCITSTAVCIVWLWWHWPYEPDHTICFTGQTNIMYSSFFLGYRLQFSTLSSAYLYILNHRTIHYFPWSHTPTKKPVVRTLTQSHAHVYVHTHIQICTRCHDCWRVLHFPSLNLDDEVCVTNYYKQDDVPCVPHLYLCNFYYLPRACCLPGREHAPSRSTHTNCFGIQCKCVLL